jgi:hypothetical protein
MTRSVRIHAFGDADVLRIEDIETGEPGAQDEATKAQSVSGLPMFGDRFPG